MPNSSAKITVKSLTIEGDQDTLQAACQMIGQLFAPSTAAAEPTDRAQLAAPRKKPRKINQVPKDAVPVQS
ncbi:MAG: hypothetical protein KGL39_32715 [Patescibacteria group bacterium]|nr:hypothetical protein [Patescibacteria group bacterium]